MGTFLGTHEETKSLNGKHLRAHGFDISSITTYADVSFSTQVQKQLIFGGCQGVFDTSLNSDIPGK